MQLWMMIRYFVILAAFHTSIHACNAQDPLSLPAWEEFFATKVYEQSAMRFTSTSFWEINDSYDYYQEYPLLLIYSDGTSKVVQWSYEGLDQLIYKKEAITTAAFERYEKENIAYMVFDSILFKNPRVGNMIAGDFIVVYKKGPISIYREFYTSPVTREYYESSLVPYYLGAVVPNFYLGSLKKKLMKLVQDYPRLQRKIKDDIIGYQGQDDDILRIAEEFNAWTKEIYPYRFEDNSIFLWQEVDY